MSYTSLHTHYTLSHIQACIHNVHLVIYKLAYTMHTRSYTSLRPHFTLGNIQPYVIQTVHLVIYNLTSSTLYTWSYTSLRHPNCTLGHIQAYLIHTITRSYTTLHPQCTSLHPHCTLGHIQAYLIHTMH